MISQKLIDEFKRIIKKEYDVKLSDSEAKEEGQRLVDYFDLLMKIDNKIKKPIKKE